MAELPPMIHYCEGRWIDGTAGLCSAGIPREEHGIYLAKRKDKP